MVTNIKVINLSTKKEVYRYKELPQYLPRTGEYIFIQELYRISSVVHETYYDNEVINIYVEHR